MRTTWTFHTAGKLLFGRGASAQVGQVAARLGAKRTLLVTDSNLVRAGLADPVIENLRSAGINAALFDGGVPEPTLEAAAACVGAARRQRADALVSLGGGSNIDLAKASAAVLSHGGNAADYVGEDRIPGAVLPHVALPTTAGTGSEVSAAAVLTDTRAAVKVGIMSNALRPAAAIVDPLLTVSCPPKVTADSGIDALTHAIEAFTAVDNESFPLPPGEVSLYQGRHPLGDLLAERAIELIGRNLPVAVREPQNLESREAMALAATLAGMAFSNVGVAAVHALEYPVGAAVHCSHGAGNGLLLPYVMRFNLPIRAAAIARVGQLLGVVSAGGSIDDQAEAAIAAVEQLRETIGIPTRLRDLGVQQAQLRGFAEKAHGIRRILRVNPRPASVDDLESILRAAF